MNIITNTIPNSRGAAIIPNSRDWKNEYHSDVDRYINDRIKDLKTPTPLPWLKSLTSENYFKFVTIEFPQEKTGPMFLGQYLLRNRPSFLKTYSNKELASKIKRLQEQFNIKEKDCDEYLFVRTNFHRAYVLDVFNIEQGFFKRLAELMEITKTVNNHTQIFEKDYRLLLDNDTQGSLRQSLHELHAWLFINYWIKNKSKKSKKPKK